MIQPPPSPADMAAARQLMATLQARLAHLIALRQQLRAVTQTHERWTDIVNKHLDLSRHPERMADLIPLYRQAPPRFRRSIAWTYRFFLRSMVDPLKLLDGPAPKPRTVDFAALPLLARPCLIGPYLGIQQNNRIAEIDLGASAPMDRIVILQTGGPVDIELWRSKVPQLNAWLLSPTYPGIWTITAHTANSVTLTRQSALPSLIPFHHRFLAAGCLFVGIDTTTRNALHIPFSELSAGTYIPGASGSGKTSALHVILRSIFANLDLFAHVWLIDGKDGVAMQRYANLHPKIRVLYDEPDVWALAADLNLTMRARNAEQRRLGTDKATTDFIAVVIDELPTFVADPPKAQKKDHETFLDNLQRIAMRGRSAGLRLFLISQAPVQAQIPTTLRTNCATTISFRLVEDANANTVFGKLDTTNDPRKLQTGQAIVLQADSGKINRVQFPFAPLYQPNKPS